MIGRSCADAARAPDPTSVAPRRPSPSFRLRVSYGPTTRAHVRLLGPCFKTGREGGRRDHGPRASPRRARHPATRPAAALRTVRRARASEHRDRTAPPPANGKRTRRTVLPRSGPGPYRPSPVTPSPRSEGHLETELLAEARTGRGLRRALVRRVVARSAPDAARERPRAGDTAPSDPTESDSAK